MTVLAAGARSPIGWADLLTVVFLLIALAVFVSVWITKDPPP